MGITSSDVLLIEKAMQIKHVKNVIEYGSQNMYIDEHRDPKKPPFASDYYNSWGIPYHCIDLAGDNNAFKLDLSRPLPPHHIRYYLVTDFGTGEHIVQTEMVPYTFQEVGITSVYPKQEPTREEIRKGYYYGWKNKHDLAMVGGLILSVNPKTGNWPGHGYTYIDKKFILALALMMGYKIHHLEEHAAMGNTTDGWNIESILEVTDDREFISFEDFQELEQFEK